jgi:hypothetical protein
LENGLIWARASVQALQAASSSIEVVSKPAVAEQLRGEKRHFGVDMSAFAMISDRRHAVRPVFPDWVHS